MIDSEAVMLAFLQADAGITAVTGTRIHAARETPTEGWTPADGATLVFKTRGELPNGESGVVLDDSFQFLCYGGGGNQNAQRISARQLYRALYDALNFGQSYAVMGAHKEAGGDIFVEPETGFIYVPVFFRAQLRKTA